MRRAVGLFGDVLALIGIAFAVPLAILAIGMPFALFGRVVLWIVAML